MPNLTIKNLPAELHTKLKTSARCHHRSLNSEVIVCLKQALHAPEVNVDSVLHGAQELRDRTADYRLTERRLHKAKNAGRP